MAKLCPIFSGSKGNSYYISVSGNGILIDAGRSAKQLQEVLLNNGIDIETIRAIFVTHEHTDHISALRVFATRYNIEVYASEGTLASLCETGALNNKVRYKVMEDKPVDIGSFEVCAFHTSHDSAESLGYSIKTKDDQKLTLATDLGYVSDEVRGAITGSDVLVIESNHDVSMLKNGSYPYELKRRILSDAGHLSNDACADELYDTIKKGTKHILLAHLSEENNTPDLAFQNAVSKLQEQGVYQDQDYTIDISPVKNLDRKRILF